MKKLKVLVSFRDINNFFLQHKVGDIIFVEEERAARLVSAGVCEEVMQVAKKVAEPVVETAPVVETKEEEVARVEEKPQEQPAKRQYRKRKN